MAAPKLDPQILDHLEWIGFVQPKGLVVSAPALVRAGAILDRRDADGQRLLRECVEQRLFTPGGEPASWLPDFRRFAERVLSWSFSSKYFAGTEDSPIPSGLEITLPNEGLLRPTFAVGERDPQEGRPPWQLLVIAVPPEQDLDKVVSEDALETSPHGRLERLLRQTKVSAGLLFNGRVIRLLSAPHGESSGWLDFQVADMMLTAGRPISTALRLLLSQTRLLALPKSERLAALLADSRKYQSEVSERLAEQVLHALYELLRGFQAANDASKGHLLQELQREHPDLIYRGLLTVLLRLVFLLYAEERDMLPEDEVFEQHYSLAGLYERLRADAALYPDTMDQRYGAWAQLLVLFRMVHDGASAGDLKLPRRHGVLFDPDQYKFLEGRPEGGARQKSARLDVPLVSDGTIYRALEKLLVLDGERISYRALDVEEIGSVYQTIMGFRLETAFGRSIAIKSAKKFGAPVTVNLEELLAEPSGRRQKWLQERADRKLSETVKKDIAVANSVEDLHAALFPVVDRDATPDLVALEAMVLQPSEERRRSGSHYTPRSLTEPIVRTTLEPILARLRGEDGSPPTPEQILDLKICDPAMGSGAFLVEACRQLGEALVESWPTHGGRPEIPRDEDEVIYARRLVAQRCLYGVDRNPVAVDLAKVSLWLATLAKDHAFSFLDHALRHGDSLVGLSRRQLEAFHWDESKPPVLKGLGIRDALDRASELRRQIREAPEGAEDSELRRLWDDASHELYDVRLLGDLAVAAFFEGETAKKRESKRDEYAALALRGGAESFRSRLEDWKYADPPLVPFHWEIEFLEVLERQRPGFDAFVGNPPFAGKNSVAAGNLNAYPEWLKELHEASHGNSDLVAHFFRRSFSLLREGGALGLIATNTIAQGDTRSTGLRWICTHGGLIFAARRRAKWPGIAAVVVSILHISRGPLAGLRVLDGREVPLITAFLFDRGTSEDPLPLVANQDRAFVGNYVLGDGFIFDDSKPGRWPTELGAHLLQEARNREIIRPYLTGDALNERPTQCPVEYIIDFGDREEREARSWGELFAMVEARVRPIRSKYRGALKEKWWRHARTKARFYAAARQLDKLIVKSQTSPRWSLAFVSADWTYDQSVTVVLSAAFSVFAALSSGAHEEWVRLVGASIKDDPRYTPSDCFDTFPFPMKWGIHHTLDASGETYYRYRADLMARSDEGLTKIYNRFHDPEDNDPAIQKLRELHAAMDRAVLDAYGWTDISNDCSFLLDYEIDEDQWGSKKRPYRYRWPDEARDEVLARLLELNLQRAAEEQRNGVSAKTARRRKASPEKKTAAAEVADLFS